MYFDSIFWTYMREVIYARQVKWSNHIKLHHYRAVAHSEWKWNGICKVVPVMLLSRVLSCIICGLWRNLLSPVQHISYSLPYFPIFPYHFLSFDYFLHSLSLVRAGGVYQGAELFAFIPRYPVFFSQQSIGFRVIGLLLQSADALFFVFLVREDLIPILIVLLY